MPTYTIKVDLTPTNKGAVVSGISATNTQVIGTVLIAGQAGAMGPQGPAGSPANLYTTYPQLAANPDSIIVGEITRDSDGAATSASVVWPDGSPGTYTADIVSTTFPGAIDGYHITYGSPLIRTYTQPTVTRNSLGAVTTRPAIVVT